MSKTARIPKFEQLPDDVIEEYRILSKKRDDIQEQMELIYEIEFHDDVNTFIQSGTQDWGKYGDEQHQNENYARWFLNQTRQPLKLQMASEDTLKDYKLFCTYEGEVFRVISTSRTGGVWLSTDFNAKHNYPKRAKMVRVLECSNWSKTT